MTGTGAKSNLLVIFGDQHRGEALGCAGNPDVQTPALDRLAAEGVRFTHAYANTPVCTPSRGSPADRPVAAPAPCPQQRLAA